MRTFPPRRCAINISVAAVLLAGCGASEPPIGSPNGSGLPATLDPGVRERVAETPDYKVSGPLLYVTNSDGYDTAITIYDPRINDPSPIAAITKDLSEPEWDCIDGDGTLYVANEPGSGLGWVSEYALGKTKTLRLVTQGIDIPGECAIDGHGNLWVANFGGPTVTEYLKGSTKPYRTLTNGLTFPNGIAIDHAGNIYVGNLEPYGNSNVQVFPPGSSSPSRTITDGITWPEGIAVDAKGSLYVPNWLQCNIEEYLAGKAEPNRTITTEVDGPEAVTFAKDGWMYEVNGGNKSCNGPYPAILEFPPRSAKPSSRAISKDLHNPGGVAYYPPQLP